MRISPSQNVLAPDVSVRVVMNCGQRLSKGGHESCQQADQLAKEGMLSQKKKRKCCILFVTVTE